MTPQIDRRRVIAYRVAAQQLTGVEAAPPDPSGLAVLDLGVPDVPYGSAVQALSARTSAPPRSGDLALVWSVRGAPHLHRRPDLGRLASALWPLSDADARARLPFAQIKEGARMGTAAFTVTAEALREVVTEPMPKGEVSRRVSARVPEPLTYWCRGCQAQHISGGLFQQAGLAGGVQLVPKAPSITLAPIENRPAVPERAEGTDRLIMAYLRLLGPAAPAEVARYLGTTQTALRAAWPEGLAEVRVEGRRTWLPEDAVPALLSAPEPRLVRLVPPSDPYLQARDRALLVPDEDRRKAVWRILGNPGALVVDGEIEGIWRARAAGRRLDVTVAPFDPLPTRTKAKVHREAERVAAVRGCAEVRVEYDE